MNSKGKLSQRESTVKSNLEKAAKERGILMSQEIIVFSPTVN